MTKEETSLMRQKRGGGLLQNKTAKTITRGLSINDGNPFFEIFDPSLPLVTHFTKWAYGVMSPFGRSSPSP